MGEVVNDPGGSGAISPTQKVCDTSANRVAVTYFLRAAIKR